MFPNKGLFFPRVHFATHLNRRKPRRTERHCYCYGKTCVGLWHVIFSAGDKNKIEIFQFIVLFVNRPEIRKLSACLYGLEKKYI